MATLNELKRGDTYSDTAFADWKELLLNVFPFVTRELSAAEKERVSHLGMIPAALGGFDYGHDV